MSFLDSLVNEPRFQLLEALVLALIDGTEVKVLQTSLGPVDVAELRDKLRERFEANLSRNVQQMAEDEARRALGEKPASDLFRQVFGGGLA